MRGLSRELLAGLRGGTDGGTDAGFVRADDDFARHSARGDYGPTAPAAGYDDAPTVRPAPARTSATVAADSLLASSLKVYCA
jgi:hypothetical protein